MGDGDVVVVGSANIDMAVKTLRMPDRGETVIGGGFAMVPGGKGANQAVASSRLGCRTCFIGKIGTDLFGDIILRNLEQENVITRYVLRDPSSHSGVALIIIDERGENTIVVAPGANQLLSPEEIASAEEAMEGAKVLITQLEIPLDSVEMAISMAHDKGLTVILNPAPARGDIPSSILEKVDVLTPNKLEASLISGIRVNGPNAAKEAARRLLELGPKVVVVTMGGDGALLCEGDRAFHFLPHHVDVVDTTAAGDAFNGALAASLAEGKGIEDAVFMANCAGALAVTVMGAQPSMPRRDELYRFIEGKKGPRDMYVMEV
jgi:ribokinase